MYRLQGPDLEEFLIAVLNHRRKLLLYFVLLTGTPLKLSWQRAVCGRRKGELIGGRSALIVQPQLSTRARKMFAFFTPTGKVQKDKRIMRETDARMAKYSRRGIVINFLVFLAVLAGGQFFIANRSLAILLAIGLLVVTFARAWLLFRFDSLYPRAPRRWRSRYFITTLFGAIWWGLIIFTITLSLKLKFETPLIWLYTIIFFSTTAHAFAPYQKFLSVYQFFGLVPGAVAALLVGGIDGYTYGLLTLVFYLLIRHQCEMMAKDYWERHAASYELSRKEHSLEEEKKDTLAATEATLEFLRSLKQDLRSSCPQQDAVLASVSNRRERDNANSETNTEVTNTVQPTNLLPRAEVETITECVEEYYEMLDGEVELDEHVFNVRHEIQDTLAFYVDRGVERGILVESSLSPTIPMRLIGDARRFSQVIEGLSENAIASMHRGIMLLRADFVRESEERGYLKISVQCLLSKSKRRRYRDSASLPQSSSLKYSLSKAVIEGMKGVFELTRQEDEGISYEVLLPFDIPDDNAQIDFHGNSLRGQRILLVDHSAKIVDLKRQELESLGMKVVTETQYDRAISYLREHHADTKRVDSVIYYAIEKDPSVIDFNHQLCDDASLQYVHQFIAVSREQRKRFFDSEFINSDYVHLVDRPMGYFEFESKFVSVFPSHLYMAADLQEISTTHELDTGESAQKPKIQIIAFGAKLSSKISVIHPDVSIAFFDQINLIYNQLETEPCDVVLIDCDDIEEFGEVVRGIRERNFKNRRDALIPILGTGSQNYRERDALFERGLDDYLEYDHPNLFIFMLYWSSLNKQ